MSAVGITENVKGDNKKFEIWYNGREEVYIIQASSVELKNLWVSEIRKVLTGQLEACREASQLHQRITESVYHAPMNSSRYSRKSASLHSDSTSPENSNKKNRTSSPSSRQMREAFQNSVLAQTECDSTRTTGHVPRSVSQTGWPTKQLPSLDTYEDFEVIPSSNDELSNSSDLDEETNFNNGSSLFRVEGNFEACSPESVTLQPGDLVQFVQGGENGLWLVKEIISQKNVWIPSSLLHPAEGDCNAVTRNNYTEAYSSVCDRVLASAEVKEKENELARNLAAKQRIGS